MVIIHSSIYYTYSGTSLYKEGTVCRLNHIELYTYVSTSELERPAYVYTYMTAS